jgi:asparagine synthase (glutamine-hydrolysing)
MADTIIARGQADCPRLDTYSCYNDSEPHWNERPYFTKVEEKRGRKGWHVNVAVAMDDQEEKTEAQPSTQLPNNRFVPTPGYDGRTSRTLGKCLSTQGNRVVLSGIGGDEVMGGVPTPTPELQDLLARGSFRALARQLKIWALQMRKPWLHLFWEALQDFLPPTVGGVPEHSRPAPWLRSDFTKRYRDALQGYPCRTKVFGALPTFQFNRNTIDYMRKQFARTAQPFEPPFEKRYPFVDRDLLEFMYAIPREQLVRPTQRRSLMRRALVGIVPDEILNRKTKAFVSRAPMVAVSKDWSFVTAIVQNMFSASLGIVDTDRFLEILQKARRGEEVQMLAVNRTLFLEGWLKDLLALGCINIDATMKPRMTLQESEQR